jgi:hypothetical protein
MWLARVWFLLVLGLAAVLLSGALTLPGFRDERVAELRAQQAAIEAQAVRTSVAAEVAALTQATHLAALDPELNRTLASIGTDMPEAVARTLVDRSLARLAERSAGIDFLLVASDGTVRGASSRLAGDAAGLARLPLVKAAQGGPLQLDLQPERALAAVALPLPPPDPAALTPAPAPGVVLAATRSPAAAALAAYTALNSDGAVLVTAGELQVGSVPARANAALAAAPLDRAIEVSVEGAAWRARRFELPGASLVVAWPADAPATFSDAGGIAGLFSRAIERGPETGVLLGAVLVLWLLGILLGEALQRRVVRRVAAEVESLAAGPEPVPVELDQIPVWLRALVAAANDAALEARRKAPRREPRAAETSEISAERVLRDAPSRQRATSTPPPVAPEVPRPDSDPPEHFLGSPPAARASLKDRASLDEGVRDRASLDARPSERVRDRASLDARPSERIRDRASLSDGPGEAELVPGEGTAELPGRRVGAAPRERLFSVPGWPREGGSEEVTREVLPRRSFDRPGPVEIDEDDDESTADHPPSGRPLPRRPTTPPPMEDAEHSTDEAGGSVFDLSLPAGPTARRWRSDPPAPAAEGSMPLPSAAKKPSLLEQLRSKSALDPQPAEEGVAGESTVVRPIPLLLLDASAGKDAARDADQTAVGPPPGRSERDLVERAFQQVFEEFIAIKRSCGEPTHTVDYARFRAKLVRTRKSLMERFACTEVRFRVYVKDGRAALKAAPIIDGEEGEETLG